MDTTEQINQLKKEIEELKRIVNTLSNASQINPEVVKAVERVLFVPYNDTVADYDRAVNESGSSTYTVAAVYDGLMLVNGKVIGYYNPA